MSNLNQNIFNKTVFYYLVGAQFSFMVFLYAINRTINKSISNLSYNFIDYIEPYEAYIIGAVFIILQYLFIEIILNSLQKKISKLYIFIISLLLTLIEAYLSNILTGNITDFRVVNLLFLFNYIIVFFLFCRSIYQKRFRVIYSLLFISFVITFYYNYLTIRNYHINGMIFSPSNSLIKNDLITNKVTEINKDTLKRLFVVGIDTSETFDKILKENQFAGVFFNKKLLSDIYKNETSNNSALKDKIVGQYKNNDYVPMIMSFDYSGPTKDFLYDRFNLGIPSQLALGSVSNYELIYNNTKVLSKGIKDTLGLNTLFGPVVDLKTSHMDSVIKSRSFGIDPKHVSKASLAYSYAFQKNNIQTVLKHFPGHPLKTNKDTNTHYSGDVEIYLKKDTLINKNLYPFKELINNPYVDVNLIMTDHIIIKDIAKNTPITIFRDGITRLNTDYKINYKNKFIVDDILMLLTRKEKFALQTYKNQTRKKQYNSGMKKLLDYSISTIFSGHHFILSTLTHRDTINDFFIQFEKEILKKDKETQEHILNLINNNTKFLKKTYGKKLIEEKYFDKISKIFDKYFLSDKTNNKILPSFLIFNGNDKILNRSFYDKFKTEKTLLVSTSNHVDDFYLSFNKYFNIDDSQNIDYFSIKKENLAGSSYVKLMDKKYKEIVKKNNKYKNIIFALTDSRDIIILNKLLKKNPDVEVTIFIMSNPDMLFFGRDTVNKSIDLEKILTTSNIVILYENSNFVTESFFHSVIKGSDQIHKLNYYELPINIPNIHYYSNIEKNHIDRHISMIVNFGDRSYYTAAEYFMYKDFNSILVIFLIMCISINFIAFITIYIHSSQKNNIENLN